MLKKLSDKRNELRKEKKLNMKTFREVTSKLVKTPNDPTLLRNQIIAFRNLLKAEIAHAQLSGVVKQWQFLQDLYEDENIKPKQTFKIVWPENGKYQRFPINSFVINEFKEIHLRSITEQSLILSDYQMEWSDKHLIEEIQRFKNIVENRLLAFRARDQKWERLKRSSAEEAAKILRIPYNKITSTNISIPFPKNVSSQMVADYWPYDCWYGNFCGPLCGDASDDPIDPCVDEACKKHDECYEKKGYFSSECDYELLEDLWSCDPGDDWESQLARIGATIFFVPALIVEEAGEFVWGAAGEVYYFVSNLFADDDVLTPAANYGPDTTWYQMSCYEETNHEDFISTYVFGGVEQNVCHSLASRRDDIQDMRSVNIFDKFQDDHPTQTLPEGMKICLFWRRNCWTSRPYGEITVPPRVSRVRVPNLNRNSANYRVYNNFHQDDGGHRELAGHVRGFKWWIP